MVALTIGLIGTLEWLFSIAYDALSELDDIPDPAVAIALAVAGAAIWAWRWLPAWDEEPNVLRNFYVGFVTAFSLTMAIGAGVSMISTLLTFVFGDGGPAGDHFDDLPLAMAIGMFAFFTLGDDYFAYGAMAGLISAVIAGLVCVLLGDL